MSPVGDVSYKKESHVNAMSLSGDIAKKRDFVLAVIVNTHYKHKQHDTRTINKPVSAN